jgi:hypothetical protein
LLMYVCMSSLSVSYGCTSELLHRMDRHVFSHLFLYYVRRRAICRRSWMAVVMAPEIGPQTAARSSTPQTVAMTAGSLPAGTCARPCRFLWPLMYRCSCNRWTKKSQLRSRSSRNQTAVRVEIVCLGDSFGLVVF